MHKMLRKGIFKISTIVTFTERIFMYSSTKELEYAKLSNSFASISAIHSQEKLDQLSDTLRYHEYKYYVQNQPIITDQEYDKLYKLLVSTETIHPEWIKEDSPSQRVSNDMISGFETVSHMEPMLSLDNTYSIEDLTDFDKRVKKLCNLNEDTTLEYLVEPKYDGGSLAILYQNDQLIRAATRGDGIRGDEMTLNAKTIRSLPLSASFSKFGIKTAELRGEAIIRKDRFIELNAKREATGQALLANPRNAATGVLRVKDPKETAVRQLDLFAFQFSYARSSDDRDKLGEFNTQNELIKVLGELGFLVPVLERRVCEGIQQVHDFIQDWAQKRDDYSYELDGMVVKVNSLALQRQCGSTAHHPRWAVAYKFQAKQATSKLLQVEFQIGKIGSITPVAKIEPVTVAGVTVSSISLHNEDFIRSKDIRLNDQVLIERAGDVIPYIVQSYPELRTEESKEIDFPLLCPSCKTPLVRAEEEAAWRCPNYYCPAQIVQRLIHHVSKDAMDIDGLGSSLIERFFDLGWLKDMSDIYRLDYESIAKLEGMGVKSAEKLRAAIEKAKSNPLHRVLHSLCIHHLGKKVSKLIAAHLDHLLHLKDWTLEQFKSIKDVGPVVGQNIIQFFNNPANLAMLEIMESLGVNFYQTEEDKLRQAVEGAVFSGKTILFTGTLETLGRKEAQELAEKAGARNLSAVSSQLNFLVIGADAGSKLAKAKALGTVTILTESEFLGFLQSDET